MSYQDSHRKELKDMYKDFETFKTSYTAPKELIDSIFNTGKRLKVTPADDQERDKTIEQISLFLKALTARDIWDMSEYYSIINEDNDAVKKALEVLNTPKKKK